MLAKREGMGPFCVLLMADSRAERAAEPSLVLGMMKPREMSSWG